LPPGKVRVFDNQVAGMGEPGKPRAKRGVQPLRAVLAPCGEQFGVALAFGLDQLVEEFGVAVAHAVSGEPYREGDEILLKVIRSVGEGGERGEQLRIRALKLLRAPAQLRRAHPHPAEIDPQLGGHDLA
jgi:hypothetical protein